MSKSNTFLMIDNEIIQNKRFYLSHTEFHVFAQLAYWYFRQRSSSIQVSHHLVMNSSGINDSRTLKKVLGRLFEVGIIKSKINSLPKKKPLDIELNEEFFKPQKYTKMPVGILNKTQAIGTNGIRLLFYYRSFTNDRRDYCYPSFDTIAKDLKMSKETINNLNDLLVEKKLLKIERHDLKPTYEYGEDDVLEYNKYPNHYYVLIGNI